MCINVLYHVGLISSHCSCSFSFSSPSMSLTLHVLFQISSHDYLLTSLALLALITLSQSVYLKGKKSLFWKSKN